MQQWRSAGWEGWEPPGLSVSAGGMRPEQLGWIVNNVLGLVGFLCKHWQMARVAHVFSSLCSFHGILRSQRSSHITSLSV